MTPTDTSQAASIQGRVAQGPDAGAPLERLNRIAAGDRESLEPLCRNIARPPFAAERRSLTPDGRVVHELRRGWRDGTTHVVLISLERLAALVPPPRTRQQTYHGVLAPSSSLRDDVVIAIPASRRAVSPSPAHRYLWSKLMRRVFGVDVPRCNHCRSRRLLVSLLTERSVIGRIRAHLALDTYPTPIQPARTPPQLELAF